MTTRPVLKNDQIASPHCYSIDLYCRYDNEDHVYGEFPHTYTGHSFKDVQKQFMKAGWRLSLHNYGTCPKCVKALQIVEVRKY